MHNVQTAKYVFVNFKTFLDFATKSAHPSHDKPDYILSRCSFNRPQSIFKHNTLCVTVFVLHCSLNMPQAV